MEPTENNLAVPPVASENSADTRAERLVVNPIALVNCAVQLPNLRARVIDISYVRVVAEVPAQGIEAFSPPLSETEPMMLELLLDRLRFQASVQYRGHGDGWLRFSFEKMLPSSRAHLRSFLSPKKIGESLIEDWRNERLRHFHGLNESELWFDPEGGVLFTYLDPVDCESQFLIRLLETKGPLQVGKILRKHYIELGNLQSELPLIPLSDREIFSKLGECRDIVTNFRPNGQLEYHLKQRLLKVISENLYSTSHRVEIREPRAPRLMNLPLEN